MLLHPGPASIDCRDCQRFIYDLETGERKTYRAGPTREERPCVRPRNVLPPCDQCPKNSPEDAEKSRLAPANWKALTMYLEARASGLPRGYENDPIVRRNMAIIDQVYREFDRKQMSKELAHHVALLFRR